MASDLDAGKINIDSCEFITAEFM